MRNLTYKPPRTRLIVIGGFLGAGKTTAILRIARRLLDAQLTIGIVTNDQGSDLVDTQTMKQHGLDVIEISGGCFCCDFDTFAEELNRMSKDKAPDVILAEPVGSCINLVATVMTPLARMARAGNADQVSLSLAPLSVVIDPRRLDRVIRNEAKSSVQPDEIGYLFLKQLEEADMLVLNKCDQLSQEDRDRYTNWLKTRFPGATVMTVSAAEDTGMADWADWLRRQLATKKRPALDVQYDTYAEAEASLAWLNARADISVPGEGLDGNRLLSLLIEEVRNGITDAGGDTVHLKAHLVSGNDWAKISCTGNDQPPRTDHKMATFPQEAILVLNVRAVADPEMLQSIVSGRIARVFGDHAHMRDGDLVAFRPAYAGPSCRTDS